MNSIANNGTCVDCGKEVELTQNGACSLCGSNSIVKRHAISELNSVIHSKTCIHCGKLESEHCDYESIDEVNE